jgi:hypothetical protein
MIEGLVIVASILLAFAIDAGWDHRGDAENEARAVSQYVTELELLDGLLDDADRASARATDAASLLLAMIHGDQAADPTAVDDAIAELFRIFYLADAMVALDRLIGAGTLNLISSSEARDSLANLSDWLGVLDRFEDLESSFLETQLKPYLNRHHDMFRLNSTGRRTEIETQRLDGLSSRFPTDIEPLLSDRQFSNLLLERLNRVRAVTYFRIELRKEMENARALIQEVTASGG